MWVAFYEREATAGSSLDLVYPNPFSAQAYEDLFIVPSQSTFSSILGEWEVYLHSIE
jgi:hypothetical protein